MSERDEPHGPESGTPHGDYLRPAPRSPWEWAPDAPAAPRPRSEATTGDDAVGNATDHDDGRDTPAPSPDPLPAGLGPPGPRDEHDTPIAAPVEAPVEAAADRGPDPHAGAPGDAAAGVAGEPPAGAHAGAGPDPRAGRGGEPSWYGPPAGYGPGEVTSPFARPPGGFGPSAGGPGGPPYGMPPGRPGEPGRPRRGRALLAVAAVAAVVGGLVGGGTVALVDHNSTSPVAASVSRTGATAPNTPASANGTVSGAAAAISPSVVTLAVQGDNASATGSGVVVRSDGYILTNDHVVSVAANRGTITATFADGKTVPAKIVGRDASTDLAVVKVDNASGLTAATFADSAKLTVGQTVVAVGSPLGLDHTVTSGIVSALNRATRGGEDNQALFDAVQTDAPINPGNSGGPLVDLSGHVVGINAEIATAGSNSSRFPGQSGESGNIGIGFAIPSNVAADIADQLIADGTAEHAYLGVELSAGTDTGSSTGGAKLSQVTAGGPAAHAGLRADDVVTKLDSQLIGTADDLAAAVRTHKPGDQVTLTVLRGGRTTTVTATLGSDAKK
jgi:putative serine protease PepD